MNAEIKRNITHGRGGAATMRLLLVIFIAHAVISVVVASNSANGSNNINRSASGQHNASSAKLEAATCQPDQGMWGDVDPNIFYICDEHTRTARQLRCPEGRGFFKGLGYYGCIPYAEWPACLASGGADVQQASPTCDDDDDDHALFTWEAVDPNKFYMCHPQHPKPLLVNCEPGRGYVSAWVGEREHGGTKIVGCAMWQKWRFYMHCEQFY